MIGLGVAFALIVALLAYFAGMYSGLAGLRNNIETTWADIGALLERRHDEFPTLLETCRRHMQFEQETLDRVTRARTSVVDAGRAGNIAVVGAAEQQLRAAVSRLFAVAESYPTLKSDAAFQGQKTRITALGESIADHRERYNGQVTLNNLRVKLFPDVLIAAPCGFRPAPLLEFSAAEKRDIDLAALFRA